MSGGATNDVAIDDPDFWTKVVGLAGTYDTSLLAAPACRTGTAHPTSLLVHLYLYLHSLAYISIRTIDF